MKFASIHDIPDDQRRPDESRQQTLARLNRDAEAADLHPAETAKIEAARDKLRKAERELEAREEAQRALVAQWNDTLEQFNRLGERIANMRSVRAGVEPACAARFQDLVDRGGEPYGTFDCSGLASAIAESRAGLPVLDAATAAAEKLRAAALEALRALTREHDIPRDVWPPELTARR